MKKQFISTCGKFNAVKLGIIPETTLQITGIHYQVNRIETQQTVGHIYLDATDNRFKFSCGCLTILAGLDFLDLQCLLSDISTNYKRWKRKACF